MKEQRSSYIKRTRIKAKDIGVIFRYLSIIIGVRYPKEKYIIYSVFGQFKYYYFWCIIKYRSNFGSNKTKNFIAKSNAINKKI